MTKLARLLLVSSYLYPVSLFSSQIALGVTEADLLAQSAIPTQLPTETKSETMAAGKAPAEASQTFVSDGTPVSLQSLGLTVTPPVGWEVSTMTGSLSAVMREPRIEAPSYDKPKYQRNITLATVHKASPIDEKRASELKDEMTKTFGADALVEDFQIIEHKFFNYRGQNDGLLVYSSLKVSGYPMMQMHVLVSGQAKQFLMTYTDLAERFSDKNDGSFDKAWSTIVSAEVTGATPNRYDSYMRYGAGVGGVALLALALFLIRRRSTRFDFGSEADALLDDDLDASPSILSTLADGWRLDHKGANREQDEDFASGMAWVTTAAKTRKSEYVSNY